MKIPVGQSKAGRRDTLILHREFRAPLPIFAIAVRGGGLPYKAVAELACEPVNGLSEAISIVLAAAFLKPAGASPLRHDHTSEMHTTDTRPLNAGDTLAAPGSPERLRKLIQDSR